MAFTIDPGDGVQLPGSSPLVFPTAGCLGIRAGVTQNIRESMMGMGWFLRGDHHVYDDPDRFLAGSFA